MPDPAGSGQTASLTAPAVTRSRRLPTAAYLIAGGALVLLGAVLNLAYLMNDCPLDLAGDEAHYWEWSRRLDLSYYSKGPLVAYVIAGGRALLADWSESVVGSEMLAVRVPALILSVLTGLGVLTLAWRVTRSGPVTLGALLIAGTVPMASVGAKLMTIDAPLATCWVWALVAIHAALQRERLVPWLIAGLLTAVGLLAKYNMVFIFGVVGSLLLIEPRLRRFWKQPGPYLAAAIGLGGLLPIMIWNAQHGWVSFRHVAGQAGVAGETSINLLGPIEYLLGQLAVGNMVWVVGMWIAGWVLWRRGARATPGPARWENRLLVIAMYLPWLIFLGFSPITKIQPNWPALAYVTGPIVLALWLRDLLASAQRKTRRRTALTIIGGAVGGVLAIVLIHNTPWLMPLFKRLAADAPPWELTPVARYDPTARLRGWSELGAAVGEIFAEQRAAGRDPFIVADDYQVASQLAFYTPSEPNVYCIQALLGDRYSQYDLWMNPVSNPREFLNRPVIYVGATHKLLSGDEQRPGAFENLRPAAVVEATVRGAAVQVWGIHVADRFRGFPETAGGPSRY
jgi:4-amino-4-deoxy-L-arabinose transferase-like glycosyltransferase